MVPNSVITCVLTGNGLKDPDTALNQVGGKVWEDYYDRMRALLLRDQRPSGEWYNQRLEAAYGPVYQTAIAVLILSVPTHYLPIYQK